MDNLPRQKLKLIITKYGVALHDDPKRCEALLRDFCGQYRQEINLLINTQKENIPAELLNSQNSSLPIGLTIARLSKRLEDNLTITSEGANWSVESWALALNLITEAEIATEKPVSPTTLPSPYVPSETEQVISEPEQYLTNASESHCASPKNQSSQNRQYFMLIISVSIFLTGLAGANFTWNKLYRMKQIRGFIPGAIVETYTVTNKWESSANTYWIEWSDRNKDSLNLPKQVWNRYEIGDDIEIVFTPDDDESYHREGIYASDGNFGFDYVIFIIELGIMVFAVIKTSVTIWRLSRAS